MASLRDWGLLDRATGDQVELTDLAHRMAHPSSESEVRDSLREAFFNAEPFAAIYGDSAKETDLSVDFIANRAVTSLGIAAQSKQRFATSFVRSVVVAELGESGSKGSVRLLPPASSGDSSREGEAEPLDADPVVRGARFEDVVPSPRPRAPTAPAEAPPTLHQRWPVHSGTVLLEVRLGEPLPGSAFMALSNVMKTLEAFVAELGKPEAPHRAPVRSDDPGASGLDDQEAPRE
ncbi:MAG: hypothetical protein ACYDHH_24290 [Solirubrobacteraceae bacterium]